MISISILASYDVFIDYRSNLEQEKIKKKKNLSKDNNLVISIEILSEKTEYVIKSHYSKN